MSKDCCAHCASHFLNQVLCCHSALAILPSPALKTWWLAPESIPAPSLPRTLWLCWSVVFNFPSPVVTTHPMFMDLVDFSGPQQLESEVNNCSNDRTYNLAMTNDHVAYITHEDLCLSPHSQVMPVTSRCSRSSPARTSRPRPSPTSMWTVEASDFLDWDSKGTIYL